MIKFVVGTDKDGVLTNMSRFKIENGIKHFKKEPINPNGYSTTEIFGVSKIQDIIFGLKYLNEYFKNVPLRKYASEVIKRLINENCEIHEITAAMFTTENNKIGKYYRKLNENWNKKNELSFSTVQYCSETNSPRDKYIACSKLSVDVMIEDKPDVALYLAEREIKVILYDTTYNKEVNHPNIIRVNNWEEIYSIVNQMKKDKINKYSKKEKTEFVKLDLEEKKNLTQDEYCEYIRKNKQYLKNIKINEEALEKNQKNFKIFYSLLSPVMFAIFRPKVIGKENIPYQGGVIFTSNHLNSFDQFLIQLAVGNRPLIGLAASSIRNTMRGRMFAKTGAIFVDRKDPENRSNSEEQLGAHLLHGEDILLFPEGTRKNKNKEGKKKIQNQFKPGAVSLAQKTGSPISSLSIKYGLFSIVRIGEPIIVKTTDDIEIATKELENKTLQMTLKNKNRQF